MQPETDLIARVLAGDLQARADFVDSYSAFVWSVICKSMSVDRGSDTARDVFSEVFLRLFDDNCRRIRLWRGSGPFKAYLAMVVLNCGRDHFRRPGEVPRGYQQVVLGTGPESEDEGAGMDVASDDPDPAEILLCRENRNETICVVRAAMIDLLPRDRELLERKHFQDQSYKTIAQGMELSVNQVGVYLGRAEKRLRKLLMTQFPEITSMNSNTGQKQETL